MKALSLKHGDIVRVETSDFHYLGGYNSDNAHKEFIAIYNSVEKSFHPLIEDSYFAVGIRITDVAQVLEHIETKSNWMMGNGCSLSDFANRV